MNTSLKNKNALVTGGGSGIGLACAMAFANDGANVVIMGRDSDKLVNAVAELVALAPNVTIASFVGDVGKEEDVKAAVDLATVGGSLDIAIANAGSGALGPLLATPTESWEHVIQTNLTGTFYTFKHAGAAMMKSGGGAICAISSIAGIRTHRFMGSYCVSKAGIDMLVQNTADELGAGGVRVNSVRPGLVNTDLASGLLNTGPVHDDYLDCMPIRRTGEVEDISNAVRFLCGPESSWITGVNLSVDGGHHLRRGPNVEPLAKAVFGNETTPDKL